MKKVFFAIGFLVVLTSVGHAQTDWIDYKIDSKLSIKMPGVPTSGDDYSVIAMSKDSMRSFAHR